MNLQNGVSLYEGLIVTLFSMGIVFLTLIVISLMLGAFKYIFNKEDSKKVSIKKEKTPARESKITDIKTGIIEEEIVAVIGGAIKAYRTDNYRKIDEEDLAVVISAVISANKGMNIGNLSIKNIKRI